MMSQWSRKSSVAVATFLAAFALLIGARTSHGQSLSLKEMQANLAKIEQSIDKTKKQMREMEDVRFLADIYFVLAEFLVDRSRYLYLIKLEKNRKRNRPESDLDFTFEKKPKEEAIEVYNRFLDKFPGHEDRDRALFFMAHEYRDLGRLEDMVRVYARLTREHPQSQYWSESKVVLGDYFFETRKELDVAMEHYNDILKRPVGPFTPLAHYKAGWVQINKQNFPKAFEHYQWALTKSTEVDLNKLPEIYRRSDIRENALMALVWPYSELKKKDVLRLTGAYLKPEEYFKKLSYSYNSYIKVLSKLGRRMNLKKRHADAARAYYEVLKNSTDITVRVDAIPRVYAEVKGRFKVWPVQDLTKEIAKTVVRMKYSQDIPLKTRRVTEKNFEIFARDAVTRLNTRAKEKPSKAIFEQVVENYKYYLWAFPNSKYRYKMKLNVAEAYYNIGNKLEAGVNYEEVARVARNPRTKKQFYDSALQSYISALKTPAQWDRLELIQVRSGLRAVGVKFLRKYKRDKAIPTIIFSIAQAYYDERRFGKAVRVFKKFLAKYPNDERASLAANQILDAHNQRENYDLLIKDGNAIANNRRIKNKALKANIKDIVKQAQIRKIQKVNGTASRKQYARNLLKFAKKFEGQDIGDQALYEAFIALRSQKDPAFYIPGEKLLQNHGDSKYAKSVVTVMGQMALVTADFRRASKYFEQFAKKYSKDPEARQFLTQAAKLRETMGDFAQARKNYARLRDYTSMARVDHAKRDWKALLKSSKLAIQPHSSYWQGLALYRLGQVQKAKTYLEEVALIQGGDFEILDMSAHASYMLANMQVDGYKKIKMVAGQEAQAVQAKTAKLQQLSGIFSKVISKGIGRWTIAALYGLGRLNKEFAEFIQKAPVPKGLNAAQKAQYKAAIKQQSSTFVTTAQKYFTDCVKNAENSQVFTQFVVGCQSSGADEISEESELRTIATAAESSPDSAVRIRKKLFDNSQDISLLIRLAIDHLEARDYAMARTILTRALEIQPKNAKIIAYIGVAHQHMKQYVESAEWFKKAMKIDPSNATALWSMASLYKLFNFKGRLKATLRRAENADGSAGYLHPLARKLAN